MYQNWFKESAVFAQEHSDPYSIGYQIQKDSEPGPALGTQVALLGFDEEIADGIRRDLYTCSFNFDRLQLLDLGNLRRRDPEFVIQILTELREAGMNIVVLGADISFQQAQLKTIEKKQNAAFIQKTGQPLFDPALESLLLPNEHLHKVKLIGYQAHLIHPEKLSDPKLKQSLSLGMFRNNMRDAEPVLRDVSSTHFYLDCIRYSELPGISGTSPSGFTSEEACQLMRYLGLNPYTNLITILGYDPKYDFHNQGVKMVSQLIWYYLDGLDNKKLDRPDARENMTQYLVEMNEYQISLAFWKSDYSGRWWVEIPVEKQESYLLPCSFMDYKMACNNEMPKRIMNELQ